MPAPPNYVFTIFAFVGFFLSLIKFPTQFHAWNVGIHLYLAWVGLECLFLGINSIIWNHNTVNWAPVWCDITTRFIVGFSIAIPATVLCINRRLYLLASPTTRVPSQADKKREIIIDLCIGIGLPVIIMILQYFVQFARYVIIEDYGCSVALLPTWVSLLVISIPPIILEFIAGVYGCLSIRAFYNRSKDAKTHFHNLSIDSNRYIRLICFSVFDLLIGIPITVFYMYLSIIQLIPFPGLNFEHYHFSYTPQFPAVVWRSTPLNELAFELNRWIVVWGAFVFFAIFGFTEESRSSYRAGLRSVVQAFARIIGIKSTSDPSRDAEGIVFYNSNATSSRNTEGIAFYNSHATSSTSR